MSKKTGLPPGSLIHVGEKKAEKLNIQLIDYDENSLLEKKLSTIEETFQYRDQPAVSWINITGIHDVDSIEKLGKHFKIHPLTLEDIVNTEQRPKFEEYEQYVFIVCKMLYFDPGKIELISEQLSLVLGKTFLITFQERELDVFSSVRERIRKAKGKIRKSGCDYLTYTLVDGIVDHYFVILESIGESIESLEEDLFETPDEDTFKKIYGLKRKIIQLRKLVWPFREVLNRIIKTESLFFGQSTEVFLRDVYDHALRVIETIESYRDLLNSMLDLHMTTMSNRMNEVMKILTIMATIFIPITFIAGIYGMNFKYMPELEWKFGYAGVWMIIIVILVAMIVFFRRKKWI
jgi:magnesium transporter